ncbi:AI-2E family transporter [Roseomonas gilardii]|uniref:AI-2E family transporter n=1 Tax=Roseomonas gilardii TaxID=257708 RepID=UPI0024A66064|nr:AI-2E family transporter [Roseomonas gilardii]
MSDPSPATPSPSLAAAAVPGVVPPFSTAQGSRQLPPPAQVPPPYSPDLKHLLTIVVAVVVISALYLAREVLIPITLAILMSFVVAPIVGLLRRLGLWRTPAVLAAVLLAMGVILVLGSIIGLQIAGLAQDLPRYQATIQRKVDTVQGTALGWVNDVVRQIDHAQPTAPPPPRPVRTPGRCGWKSSRASPRPWNWRSACSPPCWGRWRRSSSSSSSPSSS